LSNLKTKTIDEQKMLAIGRKFSEIAWQYNLKVETCSELIDLSTVGIEHGKCLDDRLISEVCGREIRIPKNKNQREICGCVAGMNVYTAMPILVLPKC
jgi:hypothetical protein